MAEIKIEKKKPVWPWILLVLIILAAIAYFLYENNEQVNDVSDDADMEEVDDMNSSTFNNDETYNDTANYTDSRDVMMLYSDSIKDSTRIGTDSTYTKTALYNLAKVVTSKAENLGMENSKAMEDLQNFTLQMDGIVNSTIPKASGISKSLKTVSTDIVSVLEGIQTKKYPALQTEVTDLKQTCNKLTVTSIDKQKMALQNFFRKANDVLSKMNS